ncbi:hypothetical protein [Plantibacter sp. YIM 135249]|uniref:hypothetical protein n=1 Tax=Plantibacter sp. YIM 135249 TaxID=3423918 RepID=UPI003D357717
MKRVWRAIAPAFRPWRLLVAAKTALAATLAWNLGHLLPGEVGDYSYYAPLGALVSMAPTLMTSVRTSLQTAAGLAVGIGIAWVLIAFGVPGWVSVAAAVGFGTVLSGLPGLGPGRDYVPIAALFVLIIGGSDANDFSVGYLLQMALGMVVGLGVNLLIVPPLYQRESAAGIIVLRRTIADDLDAMAETLHTDWPGDAVARGDAMSDADGAGRDGTDGIKASGRGVRADRAGARAEGGHAPRIDPADETPSESVLADVTRPAPDESADGEVTADGEATAARDESTAPTKRAEPEVPQWLTSVRGLLQEVEAVESRVRDAHDSRRVNPRAKLQRYDVAEDVADVAALRRIAMSMTELGDTVAAALWSAPVAVEFPVGVREPIADAARGVAGMLRAWDARDADDEVLDASEQALIELRRAIRSARADTSGTGATAVPDEAAEAMLFSLRRMDAAVRARIDDLAPTS